MIILVERPAHDPAIIPPDRAILINSLKINFLSLNPWKIKPPMMLPTNENIVLTIMVLQSHVF